MSKIRELLSTENSGFIGVHDLITRIRSNDDGASYQEIARFLYRELDNSIPYAQFTELAGKTESTLDDARWVLYDLSEYGEPSNPDDLESSNYYGFDEQSVIKFLKSKGIEVGNAVPQTASVTHKPNCWPSEFPALDTDAGQLQLIQHLRDRVESQRKEIKRTAFEIDRLKAQAPNKAMAQEELQQEIECLTADVEKLQNDSSERTTPDLHGIESPYLAILSKNISSAIAEYPAWKEGLDKKPRLEYEILEWLKKFDISGREEEAIAKRSLKEVYPADFR